MAEEIRRSGRATKGQHTKNLNVPDVSAPKRTAKGKSSKLESTESDPPGDDGADAVIRCICGYSVEDEDDDRVMVICDNCDAWQHNECMEISENSEDLPELYYCEECKPEDHLELLAKVSRGEKPWKERDKERERLEDERKARRRKGGKKGKKGRASEVKPEKTQEVKSNGTPTHTPVYAPAYAPATTPTNMPVSVPIKTPHKAVAPIDTQAESKVENGQKRKLQKEATPEMKTSDIQEPLSKIRKTSDTVDPKASPQRRKSSVMAAPSRRDSKDVVFQTELVENISDLQHETRRKVAGALVRTFVDQTQLAQKSGTFKVPQGQKLEPFGLRLGLAVEYAVYLNFWGQQGDPSPLYGDKFRSINYNVKKNPALRDRLLNGSLSPNEFSKMSVDDMASKELQEKTAEMKKEAEKQHMLIQEDGPRIRRTHKGEELVGDDSQQADGTESIFSHAPAPRRTSEVDANAPREPSPMVESPDSPAAVELPEITAQTDVGVSAPIKPLAVDTQAPSRPAAFPERKSSSTFNIQNVWSSVDTPETEKQRPRQPPRLESSVATSADTQGPGVEADVEIDQLLKDEEPEEEEPYSPTDYAEDPNSPIWRGKIIMETIAEFHGTAKHVAGANVNASIPWSKLMPSTLTIEGRIDTDRASEYLCGLRWSHTTDVSVVSVTPTTDPDSRAQFDKLFKYFTERKRYGVIGKSLVPAVKDTYVVPLDHGMSKKPDFIELLEYCTIEDPCPERMLLLTFVIKSNNTPSSAQATPRHLDTAAVASPIGAGATGHSLPHNPFQTPTQSGHPGSQISPVPSYPGSQAHLTNYGSPAQPQHVYMPPLPHQAYPQPYIGPAGIEAARQALGDLANVPSIGELLAEAPHTGVLEFQIIKELLESVPATRNDFQMLKGLLTMKHQQGSAGSA